MANRADGAAPSATEAESSSNAADAITNPATDAPPAAPAAETEAPKGVMPEVASTIASVTETQT